jgi:2-polyprenyl-3-methyl-5-hydroxy-6-metoxy-1,4-benzoquinol methylase
VSAPADSTNIDSNQYGWESALEPDSCSYVQPKVIEILRALGVQRVCDLGSGNGSLAGNLYDAGWDVVGVEPDGEGVEISRKQYPGISFHNLGVQDDAQIVLKAEGGAFDAVVSTEVVEHLYSPHLLPIFARELLNDGGYLIVSTPYHGYLKNLALSIFGKWDSHHTPLWHGGHIKFWSRRTLSYLLEQTGFSVVAFYGVGRVPWLWKSMIIVGRAM